MKYSKNKRYDRPKYNLFLHAFKIFNTDDAWSAVFVNNSRFYLNKQIKFFFVIRNKWGLRSEPLVGAQGGYVRIPIRKSNSDQRKASP